MRRRRYWIITIYTDDQDDKNEKWWNIFSNTWRTNGNSGQIKTKFSVVLANSCIDVTTQQHYSNQRIYSIPQSVVFCPPNVEKAGMWLNVCHVSFHHREISRYWKFFRCFFFPRFPSFIFSFFILVFTFSP